MPSAFESKKPLIVALAALLFLTCGGCGTIALIWSALRRKPSIATAPTPPQGRPIKNQRIELDYSEKAEKESNARRNDSSAKRNPARDETDAPSLPPNTLFPSGKFPAGYNPNAAYRGFLNGSPRTLKFQANGTFVSTGDFGLKNPNPRDRTGGAESDGTFRIDGNALTLKFNNGETRESIIKPFEVYKDPPQTVLIDGEIFEVVK